MNNIKAIVVHSGGMDSSICLKLAINRFGAENVLALGFDYDQRHLSELEASKFICKSWGIKQTILSLPFMKKITHNSLTDHNLEISSSDKTPNSLVVGRNGLMARIASIHADSLGAQCIYLGVIEVEEANSGYRDCNRDYFDKLQEILRIDFDNTQFEILSPIIKMTKAETMELADSLGVLDFLITHTITCYEGVKHPGCGTCPSCLLRNEGIEKFRKKKGD